MRRGQKKKVIGFTEQLSTIHVQVRGRAVGKPCTNSRSFTVRLRGQATNEQIEDLRDFLLEAAKDWYEELKK